MDEITAFGLGILCCIVLITIILAIMAFWHENHKVARKYFPKIEELFKKKEFKLEVSKQDNVTDARYGSVIIRHNGGKHFELLIDNFLLATISYESCTYDVKEKETKEALLEWIDNAYAYFVKKTVEQEIKEKLLMECVGIN